MHLNKTATSLWSPNSKSWHKQNLSRFLFLHFHSSSKVMTFVCFHHDIAHVPLLLLSKQDICELSLMVFSTDVGKCEKFLSHFCIFTATNREVIGETHGKLQWLVKAEERSHRICSYRLNLCTESANSRRCCLGIGFKRFDSGKRGGNEGKRDERSKFSAVTGHLQLSPLTIASKVHSFLMRFAS